MNKLWHWLIYLAVAVMIPIVVDWAEPEPVAISYTIDKMFIEPVAAKHSAYNNHVMMLTDAAGTKSVRTVNMESYYFHKQGDTIRFYNGTKKWSIIAIVLEIGFTVMFLFGSLFWSMRF